MQELLADLREAGLGVQPGFLSEVRLEPFGHDFDGEDIQR